MRTIRITFSSSELRLCSAGVFTMIVCVCHRVSDRDIAREAHAGCTSFDQLQDDLRVGTGCGSCVECAQEVFDAAHCNGRRCDIRQATASVEPLTA
jgi:bacterioferritin-associated ferredoxin